MTQQKEFKSPVRKLVKFFEKSRNSWKVKHQKEKAENKLLKNQIRKIKASKQKLKDEVRYLKNQLSKTNIRVNNTADQVKKTEVVIQKSPLNEKNIFGHSYSATVISLLIKLVLDASVSLRGSERVLTLFNHVLGNPLNRIPCWFSVRMWLLRLGHYKLTREKQHADDWCWIMDHTIQLDKTKCLLILGLRLSELPAKGKSLRYCDLEPIDLIPVEKSSGEIVWQQLEEVAGKTGIPRAIVSDNGSDLKLGIDKFCSSHKDCCSIYDIKHKTACLLKAVMEKDEAWLEFRKWAAQTKNSLQQTALSHLKAPNQRSKARYMNMDILVKWGMATLQVINGDTKFTEAEKLKLPKLEFLNTNQKKLEEWAELLQVTDSSEQWVRKEGVTLEGHCGLNAQFQQQLPNLIHEKSRTMRDTLIEFVKTQGASCKKNEQLIGSTEIIESVFGKQKYLERDYRKEGFTSLILGIGALVGETTTETVSNALASTPVKSVIKWCKEKLGKTVQCKKILAYSEARKGTKVESTMVCEN